MTLELETQLILNRLSCARELMNREEQEDSQSSDSAETGDDEERKSKDHSEAVNDRLRQFAAFEKRYGRKRLGE